jgi:hypothetical protein
MKRIAWFDATLQLQGEHDAYRGTHALRKRYDRLFQAQDQDQLRPQCRRVTGSASHVAQSSGCRSRCCGRVRGLRIESARTVVDVLEQITSALRMEYTSAAFIRTKACIRCTSTRLGRIDANTSKFKAMAHFPGLQGKWRDNEKSSGNTHLDSQHRPNSRSGQGERVQEGVEMFKMKSCSSQFVTSLGETSPTTENSDR